MKTIRRRQVRVRAVQEAGGRTVAMMATAVAVRPAVAAAGMI